MTKYIVEGGRPLFGEIPISGAKNAAVAIIPAALMVSGPCRIENMPQISDVTLLLHFFHVSKPLESSYCFSFKKKIIKNRGIKDRRIW